MPCTVDWEGLRYRLLLVYPLRMKHNSLPASVQTLATYMLALVRDIFLAGIPLLSSFQHHFFTDHSLLLNLQLNPLGLWFTRIIVDQSAPADRGAADLPVETSGAHSTAHSTAAKVEQMAYSQVYTQVQTISVLQGDQVCFLIVRGTVLSCFTIMATLCLAFFSYVRVRASWGVCATSAVLEHRRGCFVMRCLSQGENSVAMLTNGSGVRHDSESLRRAPVCRAYSTCGVPDLQYICTESFGSSSLRFDSVHYEPLKIAHD